LTPASETKTLTKAELYLLAIAGAVVTANAYYVHPIIARVAESFDVSAAMIGVVPAGNQIALALGIFLLLPLGDRVSNRRLTGIIGGILLARAGAGFVGEYYGWRAVYIIAAVLMLVVSIGLPLMMEGRKDAPSEKQSYPALLVSLFPIARQHPEALVSGAIQALSFGIFLAIWMGLGLHLTSPAMGYGVDVVGYLAVLAIVNLATTPRLGRWADTIGPHRARRIMTIIQLVGITALMFTGHNLWLMLLPIVALNMVGPIVDISGRMTFLDQAPDIRTRLMTVYIVMMFAGGGLISWASTAAYYYAGWSGNIGLAIVLSILALSLSHYSLRFSRR
jgi:predicted MFS family arabinose efflux permease